MPLDPEFMDEQLGIDREKIAERYRQINNPEDAPKTPKERKIAYEMQYPEDAEHFDRKAAQAQVERTFQPVNPETPKSEQPRKKLARPSVIQDEEDAPIFPGGPLKSEVMAWKKQFGRVYMTRLEDEYYIWRPIKRFEYKEIMALPNTNELIREEMICELCVLFPYNYTFEAMTNAPGGIPSMLAEQIMQKSGFTRKAIVTLL